MTSGTDYTLQGVAVVGAGRQAVRHRHVGHAAAARQPARHLHRDTPRRPAAEKVSTNFGNDSVAAVVARRQDHRVDGRAVQRPRRWPTARRPAWSLQSQPDAVRRGRQDDQGRVVRGLRHRRGRAAVDGRGQRASPFVAGQAVPTTRRLPTTSPAARYTQLSQKTTLQGQSVSADGRTIVRDDGRARRRVGDLRHRPALSRPSAS